VPEQAVTVNQPNGVSALQPGHPRNQVRFRRFQHHVIVIAHQAIRMHLPTRLFASFGQSLDKVVPINIVEKNLFSSITPAHHMIPGSRIFETEFAWHAHFLSIQTQQSTAK
jgi:hypothetical protein